MYVVQWNECLGVELCPITEEIELNGATVAISESHGWYPDLPVHGSGVVIPRLIFFPRTRICPLWVKDVPICRAPISPPTHTKLVFFFSFSFIYFSLRGELFFSCGFHTGQTRTLGTGRIVAQDYFRSRTCSTYIPIGHLFLHRRGNPQNTLVRELSSYRRVIQDCGLPEQGKVYVWYLTFQDTAYVCVPVPCSCYISDTDVHA